MIVPTSIANAATSVINAFTPSTDDKPWYLSKTLWTAAVLAGAGFYPPVAAIAIANPELTGLIVAGIIAGLRFITAGKITVKKP